jgi:hypothetical protein
VLINIQLLKDFTQLPDCYYQPIVNIVFFWALLFYLSQWFVYLRSEIPHLWRRGDNLGRRTVNASRHHNRQETAHTTDEGYAQRFRKNLEALAYRQCTVCRRDIDSWIIKVLIKEILAPLNIVDHQSFDKRNTCSAQYCKQSTALYTY